MSFSSDFKALGSKLIRSQYLPTTPTSTDSEESTFMRHIDYSGDSNDIITQVDDGQKFEITVDTVILADRTLKTVRGTYNKCIGVKLRWKFLGKEATTRIIQVRGNEIPVNELYTYHIPTNSLTTLFNDRVIHFDLYAIYSNKEKYVGFSELQLSDCKENVNMQLGKCLDLLYVTRQRCCARSKTKNIGRLLIQYKLHSLPIRNKAATLKHIIETIQKQTSSPMEQSPTRGHISPVRINSNNVILKDNNPSTLGKMIRKISETVLHSTSRQKVDQFIENQQCLMEYFTEDINFGNKRMNLKSNPKSLPNITISKLSQLHHATITIIINCLKFNEDFGQSLKPDMTYYVEYSFLTKEGLETLNFPLSSDFSTAYDAKTTFKLDLKNNQKECKMISKMIKSNKALRFCVIQEPIVNPLKIPICMELCYSDVRLGDLVHNKNNKTEYPLLTMKQPHEEIGIIDIVINGLDNVMENLHKQSMCGLIYDKAKSLGSIEDKPECEVEAALKSLSQQPSLDKIPTVALSKCSKVSSKLKNILKGRSSSVTFKTTKKVTKGDVTTSLKDHKKSNTNKLKKIERAKLNRRFINLIDDDKFTSVNYSGGIGQSVRKDGIADSEIVVEKSETKDTKENITDVGETTRKRFSSIL